MNPAPDYIMPKHIFNQYVPGDPVEIVFAHRDGEWQPAVVLRLDPPGIWVRTEDGGEWFMTNTYRIRPLEANLPTDSTA